MNNQSNVTKLTEQDAEFSNEALSAKNAPAPITLKTRIIRFFIPILIIALAIAWVAQWISAKPKPKTRPQVEKSWSVTTEPIHIEALSSELELLGVVHSPSSSQLTAAINAYVTNVAVREGDFVHKGDVLIQLDPADTQLLIQQRRADVTNAQASIDEELNRYQSDLKSLKQEQSLLNLAKKAISRQSKLAKSRLTSEELIDKAKNDAARQSLTVTNRELAILNHPVRLRQLKARLQQAQSQLASTQLDLHRTTLVAPFDGYITEVPASIGNRARVGEVLVKLYDSQHIEVRGQLPQNQVADLQQALVQGKTITAEINNPATPQSNSADIPVTKLKLVRIGAITRQGAGGVDAYFQPLSTEDGTAQRRLMIGETLPIRVKLSPQLNRFSVPISALYSNDHIYLVRDERLESHQIDVTGRYVTIKDLDGQKVKQTRLIIRSLPAQEAAPKPIANGDRVMTTQLPSAIVGLKVSDRSQPAKIERVEASKVSK